MPMIQRLLASLLLALCPLLALAQPADDPPVLDLSDWVQLDVLALYGDQYPGGINPAYLNWSPPDDGRAITIKAYDLDYAVVITSGDPPVSRQFTASTDIAFQYWIGDDLNLHYFGHYQYEDSTGLLINDNYLGMLQVPAGQSPQQLFSQLADATLPTERAVYQAVTSVPEPAAAWTLLAGLAFIGWRRRPVRH